MVYGDTISPAANSAADHSRVCARSPFVIEPMACRHRLRICACTFLTLDLIVEKHFIHSGICLCQLRRILRDSFITLILRYRLSNKSLCSALYRPADDKSRHNSAFRSVSGVNGGPNVFMIARRCYSAVTRKNTCETPKKRVAVSTFSIY